MMCSDIPAEARRVLYCGISAMLWVTQTMWPHFSEWYSIARAVITVFVWMARCEGARTTAFCALKQTLHIAGDVYGLGHEKLLSGSECDLKMAVRHLNYPVFGCSLAVFRCSLSCIHKLSTLWFLKQCLELSLRKSGSVCVLWMWAKGEGQVIFRDLLQQKQQQGASVPIEVSAPSGSALPPAPLCGWAGPTASTVSQTGWAG